MTREHEQYTIKDLFFLCDVDISGQLLAQRHNPIYTKEQVGHGNQRKEAFSIQLGF